MNTSASNWSSLDTSSHGREIMALFAKYIQGDDVKCNSVTSLCHLLVLCDISGVKYEALIKELKHRACLVHNDRLDIYQACIDAENAGVTNDALHALRNEIIGYMQAMVVCGPNIMVCDICDEYAHSDCRECGHVDDILSCDEHPDGDLESYPDQCGHGYEVKKIKRFRELLSPARIETLKLFVKTEFLEGLIL